MMRFPFHGADGSSIAGLLPSKGGESDRDWPGRYHVSGNVFGDNRTGTDDNITADSYARIDNAVAADPDIISDGYGFAELKAGGADFRIKRCPAV